MVNNIKLYKAESFNACQIIGVVYNIIVVENFRYNTSHLLGYSEEYCITFGFPAYCRQYPMMVNDLQTIG